VPGPIGQCQNPGRVFKGTKMSAHRGAERVTVQTLEIVRVDAVRNLLLIKLPIPGALGRDVIMRPAADAKRYAGVLLNVNVAGARASDVSDQIFATEFNETLVHQAVVAYMAGGRQGTKQQKTRSEVSGGGKKPWRQKGTGRARAGTIRGPIWRGGGTTFAARPRNFEQKLNRKMYRGAMRSILSELIRQDRLVVV